MESMELGPRQVAFLKAEMKKIEDDPERQPTERVEAGAIRAVAHSELTE